MSERVSLRYMANTHTQSLLVPTNVPYPGDIAIVLYNRNAIGDKCQLDCVLGRGLCCECFETMIYVFEFECTFSLFVSLCKAMVILLGLLGRSSSTPFSLLNPQLL